MFRFLFLLFGTLTAGNSFSQDILNGLVACYSFSGNANDGSGHHFDGTVQGATLTADRFGNPNAAFQFNGIDNHIAIPSATLIGSSSYTISAWVKPLFPLRDRESIISVGSANGDQQSGITLYKRNEYPFYDTLLWSSTECTTGSIPIASGLATWTDNIDHWYHVVMVRHLNRPNKPLITSYYSRFFASGFDGFGSYDHPVYPPDTIYHASCFYRDTTAIAFLGLGSDSNNGFYGMIDDIAIFNRALTPDEVWILHSQGLPCNYTVPAPYADSTSRCGPGSVVLWARGGTDYKWYDSPTGGDPLFEGNPFTSPQLTTSTVYYVANVVNNEESARVKSIAILDDSPIVSCDFPGIVTRNKLTDFLTSSTGIPPFYYLFDFGDSTTATSSQSSVSHQYKSSGNYTINVTVTDVYKCQSSCSQNIQVLLPVSPPLVSNVSQCGTGSAVLTANGGTSFRWYDSKGNFLYEGNPFTTPSLLVSNEYLVESVDGIRESTKVKVTVTVFPQEQVVCSFPADEIVDTSAVLSASITSGTAPFSLYFDFGNGEQLTTSQSSISYKYKKEGIYSIKLTATDANHCQSECSEEIVILGELFIPNVITANNDSLNDRLTAFVKKDGYYIPYPGSEPFSLRIINRWGQEVFTTSDVIEGWQGRDVEAGIYFFLITLGERRFNGAVSILK